MPGPMGGPMRGPRRQGKIQRAKDFKGSISKLFSYYLQKYKWLLIIIMIFAVAGTIFNIVGPKILGNATTEIYLGLTSKLSGGSGINFEKIAHILLMLLSLYVLSMTFSTIQGFLMTRVAQRVTYQMRNDLAKKINRLPMKYFDKRTNGEILSVITNDIDTLSMSLNQSITQIISSICTVLGILVMMFSISVQMTLVALVVLPFTMFLVGIIVNKSQKYFVEQQNYIGHVNGTVEESYGGHTIIKAFNCEEKTIKEFEKQNERLYVSAWKSQFISGMMHPIMNLIGNVSYVGIAIL